MLKTEWKSIGIGSEIPKSIGIGIGIANIFKKYC